MTKILVFYTRSGEKGCHVFVVEKGTYFDILFKTRNTNKLKTTLFSNTPYVNLEFFTPHSPHP